MGSRLRCRVHITELLSHLVKLRECIKILQHSGSRALCLQHFTILSFLVKLGMFWRSIIVSKWLPNPLMNDLNLFYPPFLNHPTSKRTGIRRVSHPDQNRIWGGGKGQQKNIWGYHLPDKRKVETMFSERTSSGVPIKAPGRAGVSWRSTCVWTCSGARAVRSEASGDTPGIGKYVKVKNLEEGWK